MGSFLQQIYAQPILLAFQARSEL